ncbi:S8 family peptidase [Kribbella antibiotica]|uniref:S8 family peptidase n=1 Tax=Kribbella antibiotica TaxID=190195 RepID=UPI001EE0AA67|nr:S8 family peptidase [Kribbella antibiotica]
MASIAALAVGLTGPPQASAIQSAAPALAVVQEPLKASQASQRVTLITGDRVTVTEAGVTVEPGPGRRGIAFSTYKIKDHQYVVPADVRAQLTSDRLDRRLFDVTGLIKAKYDDKSTKSLPVIVTYTGKAQKRAAMPSAKVTRQLPGMNGAALKVDKAKAGSFLSGLGIARSADGIKKIWLDGKRQLSLDKSVPQIGAPTAWQAGFTGKGVTVAVIDSGIDAKHPDLVGKVVGAKNFLDDPTEEIADHGTHVASTIAGTGAASEGKYKGVAPDAKLYDGTVCDVSGGCPDSGILAAMEWAATEMKAKVINMSLGGPDFPDVDPLEEAVNRLTATTGALFVISAGNSGPGAGTVGSPGSADAALTVGAVDHEDKLAGFSSRGPRVGDGAVKPDVTAPGVGIMAAKAGGTAGDYYQTMSGTSMSSPHTAGAAALLVQQHPNWKAAELKGTLIASAKPISDQTVFEQGAGRIDLARGIKQSVFAEQGNLSFGRTVYPHHDDEPVTKTVTYRNLGDQAVTLSLAATLNAPDGKPAPAGSLQLSATTVTVPAGGTASVQAISSTRHDGPDGIYSGRLTATAGDVSVTSAIGVDKEAESYDLTLEAIGLDGKPADLQTYLFGLDDLSGYLVGGTKKTLRLVKGDYMADNLYFAPSAADPDRGGYYQLAQPNLRLDKDTTVVFDARSAKPIKITVPTPGAAPLAVGVGVDRAAAGGRRLQWAIIVDSPGGSSLHTAQVGPDLPPEAMIGSISSQWAQPGADGKFVNSPYVYGLMNKFPGKFPTGFQRDVKAKDLAVVQRTINVMSDRAVDHFVFGQTGHATALAVPMRYDQPTAVKFLADVAPIEWASQVYEVIGDPGRSVSQLTSPFRAYRAGRTYHERHGAAAFTVSPELVARRQDRMGFYLFNLMDADGNKGYSRTDTASTKLLSGGKVLAESGQFGAVETAGLPAAKTKYTLQATQTRQSYSAFSTRTDLSWTFTSEATDKLTQLPMVGLRYRPKVDRKNVAERTAVTVLPIGLEVQQGGTLPGIKKLELQVSGDGGATWKKAVVTSRGKAAYQAVFVTPKGAKTVSLKAHLVDAADNVTDLTTIDAYPLR